MVRCAVSTVFLALFAPLVSAQPIPSGPPPNPAPGPIVIPVTSAKPSYGYYKSGGVLVGADGYLPFDTGPYLLGGFDGLTRYSGSFVMVPPGPMSAPDSFAPATMNEPAAPLYPVVSAPSHGRLFHRR